GALNPRVRCSRPCVRAAKAQLALVRRASTPTAIVRSTCGPDIAPRLVPLVHEGTSASARSIRIDFGSRSSEPAKERADDAAGEMGAGDLWQRGCEERRNAEGAL